ncbi:MAG: hypothetical protein AAF828_12155 [Bacteroidota bacterium]
MKYLLFLLILLTGLGCQQYTLEKLPENRLHFGNTGGVTGELREYILLLDSGRLLFHDPLTDEVERVGKLKKEQLANVTQELEKVSFAQRGPAANRNTVLIYYHDGQKEEVQWNGPQSAPSPATQACFEDLMTMVREIRGQK